MYDQNNTLFSNRKKNFDYQTGHKFYQLFAHFYSTAGYILFV